MRTIPFIAVSRYRFTVRILFVLLLLLPGSFGWAAGKITLTGQVFDLRTNEAVIGASVLLKDNQAHRGTTTDFEGNFTLQVESLPVTLSVSYVGYRTEEIEIYEDGDQITVFLTEDLNVLNTIVVVGYGTQKKKEISGSVMSVPKANLEQVATSFDNLLSGAVSGVNITQSSGQPGSSSSIRIRGGNSINGGNEPLYVIDGFIMYNDNSATQTGIARAGASLNALATINPADIESMEVLKDASATAIYGSRGANGVILITTKKGRKNGNTINFSSTVGWQEVSKKLNLLNAAEWATVRNEISATLGESPAFTTQDIQQLGKGSDWQSEALQSGISQNYQLSFSGGDEKTRYAVSGNYYDQEGILLNTGFKRYSVRSNFERELTDKFRIGLNLVGSFSKQSGISTVNSTTTSNTFVAILQSSPVASVYNEDGTYNLQNPYSLTSGNGIWANPIADLKETVNETRIKRTLGNFFAEYKIIPELTVKLSAGADLISTKQNYYAPSFTSLGITTNGYSSVGTQEINSWQSELTANYTKEFAGRHILNVLGGYTTQRADSETARAVATNFGNDITKYNSLQSGSASLPSTGAITSVLNSWLGRVNYSYRERYNASFSFRADGSSRFSSNNKWGYFPSLGVSWNINEESFLRGVNKLSNLKLRASAGLTGNQEIGDYQYLSVYEPELYSFNGSVVTGYAPENLANPDLKWERTAQYNIGIDLGLLNERISIVLDGYYKKTSDLLLYVPIPTSNGYETVLDNIGSVSNKGIEFTLSADVIRGRREKDFSWRSTLVLAHNKNKVLSLGDEVDQFFPTISSQALQVLTPVIVKEGEPLGTFWGYKTDGTVQSGDDLANIPKPSWINGEVQPGDRKYVDVNGDGVIDSDDRVLLGNSQPKLTYGFTNTFNYRGFDLSFVLQGNYGNKVYNALKQQLEITTLSTNVLASFNDRWSESNPSNEIPRATSSPVAVVTDRLVESGSFLRLRNLTIGYSLPKQAIAKTGLSKARIYFSGQNLFTITGYSGYDPEVNSYEQNSLTQGIDYGAYPSARTYLFGLELTL